MVGIPKYKLKHRDRPLYGNGTYTVRHNETNEVTIIEHRFGTFLAVNDKEWSKFVEAVNAANKRLLDKMRAID